MMLFIPLFAAVVYLLLRGLESTAAQISRIALVPLPGRRSNGSASAFSSTR